MSIIINKAIKTNICLQKIQASVASGNPIVLKEFKVSSTAGTLDPSRTLDDMNSSWYTGTYYQRPLYSNTTIAIACRVPAGLAIQSVQYLKEFYIIATYDNEDFLFGIMQITDEDIPYYSSSDWYITGNYSLTIETGVAELTIDTESKTYTFTLTTNWTGTSYPYTQTVDVNGITALDNPIIGIVPTTANITVEEAMDYCNIIRAVTSANKITFYAVEPTTHVLTLQAKTLIEETI